MADEIHRHDHYGHGHDDHDRGAHGDHDPVGRDHRLADRDRLTALLHEADELPAGTAKCEALERAVRAADASGDPGMGVVGRLILINAYREVRRYDLMLTPFAWLRGAEQRHPEAFDDWAVHQFTWMHKWLPTGLIGDPRFTLAQIGALVDQLEQRYRLHGYSPHPVHDKRRALAHHIGDTAAADTHFAAWRAAEPDEMSDCPACVVDSQVGYFVSRGRFEEAIAAGQRVLDEPSDCAEQPHGVLTSLIEAYLATGRLDDAARAHLVAYRVVRGTPQSRSALHRHLSFCAVTGNEARGLEILADNLDVLTDPPSPRVLQEFAAAAALLLSRVPDRAGQAFTVDGRALDGEELRSYCEGRARTTAAAFDRRNGTDAVSRRVARTLGLADVGPVLVAVPVEPPRESVEAEPPADPVATAEAICAAFDGERLLTGAALLASLPAEVELPAGLAARVATWRAKLRPGATARETAAELLALVEPITALDDPEALARLHADIADMADSADDPDLAHAHLALAFAVARRAESVVYANLSAANAALPGDLDEAQRLVAAAAAAVEDGAPHLRGTVGNAAASVLAMRGEFDEALRIVEELLGESWPEGPTMMLMSNRARLLGAGGRIPDAIDRFDELIAYVRPYPGPWAARMLSQYTAVLDHADLLAQHLGVALDALAAARAWFHRAAVVRAYLNLSTGYLDAGRHLEAAETLEEALRLCPVDRADLLRRVRYQLGVACRGIGEHATAAEHFTAVLADCPEDERRMRAFVSHQLGECGLHEGDPGAADAFRRASAEWLAVDQPVEAAESLVRLAHTVGLDDPEAGLAALDRARDLVVDEELPGALELLADVVGFRAAVLAQHERYAEALAANAAAEELAVRVGNVDWHVFLAGRAALIRLDLGDAAGAESDARRAAALLSDESNEDIVGGVLGTLVRALTEQDKSVEADPLVRSLTRRVS
ncbi:tetratricopeptide repeat protein [Actinokineospora auranticolor]|uniref:Tetratricopeptide (TPR) repeat protein n=1 Tax=Actinokineospora auranticolor TaxID=155976 RepID=A0A2S6GNH6_9PSEU|nr:tetratricopeptide repeat protein [Actinokineospora auranticolor]PPK66784.1 tetratricopeptide (TPR) repeat protein [Actinokineospora auranticolor]